MNSAVLFLAVMYVGLLIGGISVRFGLYAVLLHELGHIVVYIIMLRRLPPLLAGIGGLSIELPCLSRGRSIVLLSSGVAMNLIAMICSWASGLVSPSYDGYFFMVANAAIALFNIVPLPFSDGGRLLSLLVNVRYLDIVEHVYAVFTALLCVGLLVMTLFSGSVVLQISLLGVIITIVVKMIRN